MPVSRVQWPVPSRLILTSTSVSLVFLDICDVLAVIILDRVVRDELECLWVCEQGNCLDRDGFNMSARPGEAVLRLCCTPLPIRNAICLSDFFSHPHNPG